MLSGPNETPEEASVPEMLIIKDIILRDIRRAHESRMNAIEERVSKFEEECAAKFNSLAARIETLASVSESAQREALSEVGKAIADIAGRLQYKRGAGGDVG